MNAEIISVGTELLLGHTINTDAAFVARELSAIGVNLLFACTVGDNPGRLRDALEEALGRSDVVITTGGLGPTDDDLTKETIASVAGAPLKIHEDSLRRLAQRMANRAVKTGRKVVLEPMNPYERRVLHTALQNHPAVTTHSEGEEPNRRVVIMLKNQPERPEKSADKPQGEKPSRSRRSRRRGPRKPVNPAENQTANEPQETVAAPESPAAVDVLGVEE